MNPFTTPDAIYISRKPQDMRAQGFEFLFLSQRPRLAAFGGLIAPKTPVLKLNRPLARKPPAAIVSESARVVCAPFAKPQVATLRHSWEK